MSVNAKKNALDSIKSVFFDLDCLKFVILPIVLGSHRGFVLAFPGILAMCFDMRNESVFRRNVEIQNLSPVTPGRDRERRRGSTE